MSVRPIVRRGQLVARSHSVLDIAENSKAKAGVPWWNNQEILGTELGSEPECVTSLSLRCIDYKVILSSGVSNSREVAK
jgi:hypothetical protein